MMFLVKLLLRYTLLPAQESLPCGAEAAEMPSHLLGSWLSCQYNRLSSSTPAPRAASCRVDGCLKPGGAAACQMSPEDETCCHRRGSASGRSLRSKPKKKPLWEPVRHHQQYHLRVACENREQQNHPRDHLAPPCLLLVCAEAEPWQCWWG